MAGVKDVELFDSKDYVERDEDELVPILINSKGLKALREIDPEIESRVIERGFSINSASFYTNKYFVLFFIYSEFG